MGNVSRGHEREQLEYELQADDYKQLLRDLQGKNLFLRQFKTWGEVVAFMRKGTSQDPRKDEILRPIFEAHVEDGDSRWRTILLVIFWPGLESIHFKKYHWDPNDPDELWQNVVWTFLQIVCRFDVKRRPSRIVQKVYNDTIYYLHNTYRRSWVRMEFEVDIEQEEPFRGLVGDLEGINFVALACREEKEAEIRRLREHMEAGRISEGDFFLLVGTKVYGKAVSDYAREVGLDYQVAKKRRQRAEAAIVCFEETNR